jgi:UDP-N-acetylmuramate--alanine ligase
MRDPASIPERVHIVGAGGSGMSGLAKILSQMGRTVTGSDLKPGRMLDALGDVGVDTWIGHRPDTVTEAGLIVRSSAVPDSDPEVRAALAAGVPVWERPALLAAITAANPAIGFAGTHGKTTSTAMAVTALRALGTDPSFLVGGEMVGLNTGAHVGASDEFVLEADEAFGTFRHLDLGAVLVTNIEADHLDYYGTVAAVEDAFAQVVDSVVGPRVACIDDPGVRRLARRSSVVTYGTAGDADWRIGRISNDADGVSFELDDGTTPRRIDIPKPGLHTALDAAGVVVLLASLGHPVDGLAAAMESYAGVRRRYEIRSVVSDVTIVDDYAHHPTEVEATVAAAVASTRGRVIAVFQPHRYTRTADLGPEFGAPLAGADHIIVTDVYAAGEQPMIGVSGRLVARSAEAAGGDVQYVPMLSDVPRAVAAQVRPGDTVLLLGAGDITTLAGPVTRAIEAV